MKDILQEIAANKRREISAMYPDKESRMRLEQLADWKSASSLSLSKKIKELNAKGLPGIIAEFKRKSPSKGEISPCGDVVPTVAQYREGGAAGCSILTDTRYFGGALTDLAVARKTVDLPLLRKDFIIDPIQIDEAFLYGGNCVLLIASLLERREIEEFTRLAHLRGLEVLLEIHDFKEVDKIIPEADMIGVNNRALSTFKTDINHSASFIDRLPADSVKIAESGINNNADIRMLFETGYNGFLVGEALMRSSDPQQTLKNFIHAV